MEPLLREEAERRFQAFDPGWIVSRILGKVKSPYVVKHVPMDAYAYDRRHPESPGSPAAIRVSSDWPWFPNNIPRDP